MEFKIITFGCKVNQVDSAGMQQQLLQSGMTVAATIAEANLLIVNSCAVTAESVRKARQALRSLRRKNPDALLLLCGCWPQAFPEDTFEDADLILGTNQRERIPALVQAWAEDKTNSDSQYAVLDYRLQGGEPFSSLPCADTTRTRAFLKIQEGCNQFCSYCIIPFARGRCRSMPPQRLAEEAAELAAQGFREIVLTGINLGFYGLDTGHSLEDAVECCAAQEGILRVRLGSLEPERMTEAQLKRLAACEKFCPQFHLSLQSGSDAVLRRMNRRYTSDAYRQLVQTIHSVFPHAAVTTDVIVGFPGETEEDFAQTLAFVEEMRFAKVHVFPYSPREGTKAAAFPDQLPQWIKNQRCQRLTALADSLRRQCLAAFVGQTLPVLVEGKKQQNAQSFLQGHTPDGTLVKIFSENIEKGLQNSVICVTIESYADDCCIGHAAL